MKWLVVILAIYATTANATIVNAPTIKTELGETTLINENSILQPRRDFQNDIYAILRANLGVIAEKTGQERLNWVFAQIGAYNESVIKQLNRCENYGEWNDRCIVDTNQKLSCGGLMFQLDTFYGKGKQYGILPATISKEEITLDIWTSPELQILIASQMIANREHMAWTNCYYKEVLGIKL